MDERKSALRCPACGSTDIRCASRDETPVHYIVLRKYRKCDGCGKVIQPASTFCNYLLLILFGGGSVTVFSIMIFLNPSIVNVLVYGLASVFGARMLYAGCRDMLRGRGITIEEEEPVP